MVNRPVAGVTASDDASARIELKDASVGFISEEERTRHKNRNGNPGALGCRFGFSGTPCGGTLLRGSAAPGFNSA